MSELKLVTRNIRINGIQHKASDMSEEEITKEKPPVKAEKGGTY